VWLAHKCAPITQAWQEQSKLYFIQIKNGGAAGIQMVENKI
jgi:hypothetical protein